LSPSNSRGHRNALAQIPFQRVTVALYDGSLITLLRSQAISGSYNINIFGKEGPIVQTEFNVEREKKFSAEQDENTFINFLTDLQQAVYFLSANRKMSSDLLPEPNDSNSSEYALVRYDTNLRLHHDVTSVRLKVEQNQLVAQII
jgi:hypothetical protein